MTPEPHCPVCRAPAQRHDVVDFHKCCEESRGRYLPLSGIPIYYWLCQSCGHCFAPEMLAWSLEDFATRVYNDDYPLVDPDCAEQRPQANATQLHSTFAHCAGTIRHLDYGGGNGLLSRQLTAAGWDSTSWDPFQEPRCDPATLGRFDLVTAFEVFEHVPDPHALLAELTSLLAPGGVVLFSTLVADGHIQPYQRLSWWYAAPRNGHINLFTRQSLGLLGAAGGFRSGSFSDNFHAWWQNVPGWARTLLPAD